MIVKLLILSYAFLQGQQVLRLEVRPGQTVAPPQPSEIGPSSYKGKVIGSPEPARDLTMTIRSMALDTSRTSLSYEFDVQNATSHNIEMPVGFDGATAFKVCSGKTFQTAYLSLTTTPKLLKQRQILVDLYGCRDLEGSLATLRPGDWLTISGSYRLSTEPVAITSARLNLGTGMSRYAEENGHIRVNTTPAFYAGVDYSFNQ